ncbi:MAG: ABC transporter permease [Planctomycetes bacterium]|nr:ABC transporter permease [Planctomycetota bacterium]
MKYQLFITRKYLTSRLIAIAAIFAVAFGVFVLMAVLTVMEGFKVEMRDRIRGSLSHIRITGEKPNALCGEDELAAMLLAQKHVVAAAPFVHATALYRSDSEVEGCIVQGIDPVAEAKVSAFGTYLLRESEIEAERDRYLLREPTGNGGGDASGAAVPNRAPFTEREIEQLFSLENRRALARQQSNLTGFEFEDPPQPIVVGVQALWRRNFWIGKVVQLSAFSTVDLKPRSQQFIVVGAFQTGIFEHDLDVLYMPIRAAQEFLGLFDESPEVMDYRFQGMAVRLDDYRNAEAARQGILAAIPALGLGDLQVRTWEEERQTLLRAVEIEKKITYVMMLAVVLFACAIIFAILWLLVIEKTRDLGVLASLGATPGGVVSVFLMIGMTLCSIGAAIGTLGGWYFTSHINEIHDWIYRMSNWRLFPPDVYYLTEIPVVYTTRDFAIILGPTLLFGFLGSLIPAVRAALKDPIKALRYE